MSRADSQNTAMSFGRAAVMQAVADGVTNAVTAVLAGDTHRQRCVRHTASGKGKPRRGRCNGSPKETLGSASGVPALVDALALVGD